MRKEKEINFKKFRNERKNSFDFNGNKLEVGDYVAFDAGSYGYATNIKVGIVFGFTKAGSRIITQDGEYKTIVDSKTVLYSIDYVNKDNLSDKFYELRDIILLPKKMNIL